MTRGGRNERRDTIRILARQPRSADASATLAKYPAGPGRPPPVAARFAKTPAAAGRLSGNPRPRVRLAGPSPAGSATPARVLPPQTSTGPSRPAWSPGAGQPEVPAGPGPAALPSAGYETPPTR